MSIIFILFTVVFLGGVIFSFIVAKIRRRPLPVRLGVAFLAWCTLYTALLVGSSLASAPRVLGLNETKEFCGFYLDCHVHVAVARIDTAYMIAATNPPARPSGVFYVVTLRVSSDAARERMNLLTPSITIRDADGRVFPRVASAENALADAGAPHELLTSDIQAGQSFLTTVVFDLPPDARDPVLQVTDGYAIDRALESVLIGDEDSFLHKRTVFRLAF